MAYRLGRPLTRLPYNNLLQPPQTTATFATMVRYDTLIPKVFENFKTKFARTGNNLAIEKALFEALKTIKRKTRISPMLFFFEAIEHVRFSIMLNIFERKKKKTVQKVVIPKLIKNWARYKKATSMLSKSVKIRKEHFLHEKISGELLDITLYKKSNVFLKKQEIYNYAHYYQHSSGGRSYSTMARNNSSLQGPTFTSANATVTYSQPSDHISNVSSFFSNVFKFSTVPLCTDSRNNQRFTIRPSTMPNSRGDAQARLDVSEDATNEKPGVMKFIKSYGAAGLGVCGATYCTTAAAAYATLITAFQPGVCLDTLKSVSFLEGYLSKIPAEWDAVPDVLSSLLIADCMFPFQLPLILVLTKRIVDKQKNV